MQSGLHVVSEIASQPDCWRQAAEAGHMATDRLPTAGERVAVVGCGTSLYMGMAYAALREAAGHGLTDAFAASEFPADRSYDRLIAITRSGTTTEILDVLEAVSGQFPTLAITADPAAPVAGCADRLVVLDFADEKSVVQTRFATSALVMLRTSLGHDLSSLPGHGRRALDRGLAPELIGAEQITFLGRSWTVGLAHEAALKLRESAGTWSESYPAMEYRHGPVSIAQPGRVTWMIGEAPAGLSDEVSATGALFVSGEGLDPIAELVVAQRVGVARALARELDPDRPRNLNRSVVLSRR